MDVISLSSGATNLFLRSNSDDEFTDRLNYRYTVGLLLFFTLIVSTKQYSSEVIKCWVPAHLIIYESYVGEICWVQNTYYVPYNVTIPKAEIEREKGEIKYYQWVNFILLFQAFLFYMPRVFWTSFSGKGGLYLSDLVDAARNYKNHDKFYKKGSYMEYLVLNIDQFVDDQRRWEQSRSRSVLFRIMGTSLPCFGRYLGNYILVLYMMTKFLYILNTILQVSLISIFLGQSFWMFGFNYVKSLMAGGHFSVTNSKYFPRVTLCDFMIREIGNPAKAHRYTVECVLPVNLFNQQIFTAIWVWYVIVLVCNVIGVLIWGYRLIPSRSKKWITMRTNLFNNNVSQKLVPRRLDHFLRFYLEPDGIFMIRMIANNTSDYVATDLIHQLWCQHDEKYGFLFPNEPHANSKRACLFNHSSIESIKKKYVTGGDNYKYPEQPSRINFDNQSKSNNYVYPEKEYSEARLRMYAEKHNINGKNKEEDKHSLHSSRANSGTKACESNSSSDEYCKLIRRRIGLALLENTGSQNRGAKNAKEATPDKKATQGLTKLRRPLLVPTNCPLINDDTTNSDDSDSYEEQAFHQHHTREEREKEEREYNEKLLLIQHEEQQQKQQEAKENN